MNTTKGLSLVKMLMLCGTVVLAIPLNTHAFLEDICLGAGTGQIENCISAASACEGPPNSHTNRACALQVQEFRNIPPGRSMIHTDSTYFIALALGYRADVAYWIAAYNEVTDYAQYKPIDECGHQASNSNSGADYISAALNGFQRTNIKTDGPFYHYTAAFSPTGTGNDVHGADGIQAIYPLHYPEPGYPANIDSIYQGTLFNMRQWAMKPDADAGLMCAVGLTVPNGRSNFSGTSCLAGATIIGKVPAFEGGMVNIPVTVQSGQKVLDNSNNTVTYYSQLKTWLSDRSRTTGTLWLDSKAPPVPVQVARLGLYLHVLQDTASHSTFCGDDAPAPPGGSDPGTYMAMKGSAVTVNFGTYCATGPHLAGHVQETATGLNALPLRDYTALNITLDELIVFGNTVAKANGWIVNPQLLPPNVVGGRSAAGDSAADLHGRLVGRIVKGQAYTRDERYGSGVVTLPLQQKNALDRLHAMNAALVAYSGELSGRFGAHARFVPFQPMPGNSAGGGDTRACFH